jgi:hypothetical protein
MAFENEEVSKKKTPGSRILSCLTTRHRQAVNLLPSACKMHWWYRDDLDWLATLIMTTKESEKQGGMITASVSDTGEVIYANHTTGKRLMIDDLKERHWQLIPPLQNAALAEDAELSEHPLSVMIKWYYTYYGEVSEIPGGDAGAFAETLGRAVDALNSVSLPRMGRGNTTSRKKAYNALEKNPRSNSTRKPNTTPHEQTDTTRSDNGNIETSTTEKDYPRIVDLRVYLRKSASLELTKHLPKHDDISSCFCPLGHGHVSSASFERAKMRIGTADHDGDLYACMQTASSKFLFFIEKGGTYQEVTVEDITKQRLIYPFDKLGPVTGLWGPTHFEHIDVLLRYFFLRYDATVEEVFARIDNFEEKFKNVLTHLDSRTKNLSPSEDCGRGCSSQDQVSFPQADTENSQETSEFVNPQEQASQPTPEQTEVDNAPTSSALVTRHRVSRMSVLRPPFASSTTHVGPAAPRNRTTSTTSGDEPSEATSIERYLESKSMLRTKEEVIGSTSAIRSRFQRLDRCLRASLGSYESEVLCIGEPGTQSNIYACLQAAKDNPEIHIYASSGQHTTAKRVAEKNIGLGLNPKLSAPFRLVFSQTGPSNSNEVSQMILLCKYYFVDAQKTQQRVFGGEPNYCNHIYEALKRVSGERVMWHETPDENLRSNGVRAQTIADTESDDGTDFENLGGIPLGLAPTPRPSAIDSLPRSSTRLGTPESIRQPYVPFPSSSQASTSARSSNRPHHREPNTEPNGSRKGSRRRLSTSATLNTPPTRPLRTNAARSGFSATATNRGSETESAVPTRTLAVSNVPEQISDANDARINAAIDSTLSGTQEDAGSVDTIAPYNAATGVAPSQIASPAATPQNEDEDGWVNVVPSDDAVFDQSPSPSATDHHEDDEDHPQTAQYEPNILRTPAESYTSTAEQSDLVDNTLAVLSAGAPRGLKRSAGDADLPDMALVIEQVRQAHVDIHWKKKEEHKEKVKKDRERRRLEEDKRRLEEDERRLKENEKRLQEDADIAAGEVEHEREIERWRTMIIAELLETSSKGNVEKQASTFKRRQLYEQKKRRQDEELRREDEELRREETSQRLEAEILKLIANHLALPQ